MKKLSVIIIALIMVLSLCSCESRFKRADQTALGFISAMLVRDEEAMLEFVHPDHKDSAVPNDEFYETLEEQYFEIGHELTALDSITKNYRDDTSLDGTVLECGYVARVNELFYSIDLIILDNDNGYGIVSVAATLNTNAEYYHQDGID